MLTAKANTFCLVTEYFRQQRHIMWAVC